MLGGRWQDSGLTFEIPVEGGVDGDAVLALVNIADVAGLGTEEPGGRWEPGRVRLFDRERLTIRPVEVRVSPHTIEVTVFTGASAADAELGAALAFAIGTVAKTSVRASDVGERLPPDDFRGRHGTLWARQLERDTYEALLAQAGGGRVDLATLRGALALGPRLVAQAKRTPDAAVALRDGFRRLMWIDLEDVHLGHTGVIPVGEGEVRVGAWTRGVPTLLDAGSAHAVELHDGPNTTLVPLAALIDAMDDQATWLSEDHLLLPGVDGEAWDALIGRLASHAVADVTTLAGPKLPNAKPDPEQLEDWTPDAVRKLDRFAIGALRKGAVIAMLLVAKADKVIEDAELDAFSAWMTAAAARPGPMGTLFPNGALDAVPLMRAAMASKIPVGALFVTTLSALKTHVGRRARREYADELRVLAVHVAESSQRTGWLAFLRPKVGREEAASLDTLDGMLAKMTAV